MIAIIGKSGAGKSTLLNFLTKQGYQTFNCDNFIEKEYKKDGFLFKAINQEIGTFLNDDNGISKDKIKTWIAQNNNNINVLEKCIYPILGNALSSQKFDFVEIPNLDSKNYDFFSLFSGVLCVSIFEKNRLKNLYKKGVDKFTIKWINQKNDPKRIKKALFGKKPIVDIYAYNISTILRNQKKMDYLISLL
ncbi:dephospho-CoA kinase [Mycoplasmopsis iners]|uniref:dephospho-CoA kinase n=1 Tax=Mycoplasmopsis iners TaxID=76630 RepID=UPI0004954868|nr:dephospho-CoA kinase [Mycoplasmopsis iners]